ncbi:MAG: signal recognition particle-docking protein FtsY, partial [archaeon]
EKPIEIKKIIVDKPSEIIKPTKAEIKTQVIKQEPIKQEKEIIIEKPKDERPKAEKPIEEKPKEILIEKEEVKKKKGFLEILGFKKKPKVEDAKVEAIKPEIKIEQKETKEVEVALNVGQEAKSQEPVFEEEQIIEEEKEHSKEFDELKSTEAKTIKKSVITSIKSIFSNKVKLSENEISSFLEEFELSLLEADVSLASATSIIEKLKVYLTNESFSKSNLLEDIKLQIKKALSEELDIDCNFNLVLDKLKSKKPIIIMFIGPNGAGKTTTISKLAYKFKSEKKQVVLSSSDTFRAGSIDQLQKHADNIGVKLIKQNYGSDPAAVAFDAVSSAKASGADYVLIDTAGRQETNVNLMQELKKIKRVVSPDITIYIGEAQSGQAITDQIKSFEQEIGITGVILTKIDTDPKGGVAISILNELKKPIYFIGIGQEYKDLEAFTPKFIIERIV